MATNIVDALRARKGNWANTRIARFDGQFEMLASFYGGARQKRAELAKDGRLSRQGVTEALNEWLAGGINAELTKVAEAVEQERRDIALRREHLAKPKFEPTDAAAALLRQEVRTWLRGLSPGDRIRELVTNPDFAAAALEAPPALSGLAEDVRERVVESYLEATAGDEIKQLAEAEEGLKLMAVMVQTIRMDVASATASNAA